jgi:predicted Zn-dependent protease
VLAQALVEVQKYPAAIEEFLVTIKLEPKEPGLRLALADAYIQAKQPDKARAALKALLEIDPEYPGARLMLESLEEK